MSSSSSAASTSPSSSAVLGDGERLHPWSQVPIFSLHPSQRRPSPPPLKDVDQPIGSGWDEDAIAPRALWGQVTNYGEIIGADSVWSFDLNEYPTGWLKADAVAAAMAFNAAYDHALQWGERVRRLDMHWHRQHEYNLNMFGRGRRGDIAPDEVHAALDNILAARTSSPAPSGVESDYLHSRLDIIWLRHSRAPPRLGLALHTLPVEPRLNANELLALSQVVTAHCLVDFREVLICVDPRASVIYGRTRESEGIARRWMSVGHRGTPDCLPRPRDPDYDERSEISGSSGDEGAGEPAYSISRSERAHQIFRHAGRNYERVLRQVHVLEREAERYAQEAVEMQEEVDRRRRIRDDVEAERNQLRLEQKASIEPSF